MGFFGCIVLPKVYLPIAELDFGVPFRYPFIQVRPIEAGLTALTLGVMAILRVITTAQICNSVIVTNTVYVIYLGRIFVIDV